MKKKICIILISALFCLNLTGCNMFSKESKYLDIVEAYAKEKYSVSIESGQDTYVKIVNDTEKGIEAYVYSTEGLMYIIEEGASEAFKNNESVLNYVRASFSGMPGYSAPSKTELETDWKHLKS